MKQSVVVIRFNCSAAGSTIRQEVGGELVILEVSLCRPSSLDQPCLAPCAGSGLSTVCRQRYNNISLHHTNIRLPAGCQCREIYSF